MRSQSSKNSPGFSLIEVLFAVLFLAMVGLAMIALNSAAGLLIANSEIKTTAVGLNNEAVSYLSAQEKTLGPSAFVASLPSACTKSRCYFYCPAQVGPSQYALCTISATSKSVQLANNRLQFTRSLTVTTITANEKYLVSLTTSWGGGINSRIKSSFYLE